ncbi:MAG: hypothetical protein ACHQ9S_23390 [Candidatus Binatia bacterium]
MKVPNCRLAVLAASLAVITLGTAFFARSSAAQSCQNFDSQCQTNGVCQADGSCTGTPKANGTACDDFNACTLTAQCQAGKCVSTSTKANGDPCTYPGLGLCATGAQCQVIAGFGAFCVPQSFVSCPKCQICDPNSGQCTIPIPCGSDPCSTGTCDTSTGACIPGHEGEACDDGNVCTTNTHCQAGVCKSGTVTIPTPTATATPTHAGATPTPVSGPCTGDCNGDGQVTVDEILTMVNIALGNAPLADCEAGDANSDHKITVDEILAAVNYALSGCPAQPSPTATNHVVPTNTPQAGTPTATAGAVTPTPTKTGQVATPTGSPGATPTGGPSAAPRSAGEIESTTKALMVLPNLLSALFGHFPGAGASLTLAPTPGTRSPAIQVLNLPFTCPSGDGTLKCDQNIVVFPPSFGPPTYTVTLTSCQVAGVAGTTLTFNGTLTAVGQAGDVCGTIPTSATVSTPSLTMQSQSAAGSTTTTFSGFSAVVSLSNSGSAGSCLYDTVDFQPTGSISVATTGPPATSTQLTFNTGSDVSITVYQYGAQCVPQIYNVELTGAVTLVTDTHSFQATYTTFDLYDDTTKAPGQDTVDISGTVNSPCFGGAVDLSTFNSLSLTGGACPIAGDIEVAANGNTDLVSFVSGGVNIDLGYDGTVDQHFTSCLDPALFVCPAP